jgi:hypothetical protein
MIDNWRKMWYTQIKTTDKGGTKLWQLLNASGAVLKHTAKIPAHGQSL